MKRRLHKALFWLRKIAMELRGGYIHLPALAPYKGNALISFTTSPFLDTSYEHLCAHSSRPLCVDMVAEWRKKGYDVDVIDSDNPCFRPSKKYDFFLDAGFVNMLVLEPYLHVDCQKIFFGMTSDPDFSNAAEQRRLDDIEKRKGVKMAPVRTLTRPTHHLHGLKIAYEYEPR